MEVTKLWKDIAKFEEGEIRSWKSKNPLLTEARASARMQAYVQVQEDYIENA